MLPPIDLHCHSTASDGGLSPGALVALAAERGLHYLALTDHDTCAGLDEARQAADQSGLELINGIELSTQWGDNGVHIVGLGFDPSHSAMLQAVTEQTKARDRRAQEIDASLSERGMAGACERALKYAGKAALGRPHIARAMVEMGYVESEGEAFDRFLGAGKIGDIPCHWPSLQTVVGWIRDAGGIAVVAHPLKNNLNWSQLRAMLADFTACGGGAMEVSYGGENPHRVIDLVRTARHFGLKMSVGSDFHRPEFHWSALGKYPPLKGDFDPVWTELGVELSF